MTRPEPTNNLSAPARAWDLTRASRPRRARDRRRKPENEIREYTILKPRPGVQPTLALVTPPPRALRQEQMRNVAPPALLQMLVEDDSMLDGPFKGSDRREPFRPTPLRQKPVRPSSRSVKRSGKPGQPTRTDRAAFAPLEYSEEAKPLNIPSRPAERPVPPSALSPGSAGPILNLAFDLPRIRSPYPVRPAAAAGNGMVRSAQSRTAVAGAPSSPSQYRSILEGKLESPVKPPGRFQSRSPYRNLLEEAAEQVSAAGYATDFATLTVDGFTFLPIDQMGRPIRR